MQIPGTCVLGPWQPGCLSTTLCPQKKCYDKARLFWKDNSSRNKFPVFVTSGRYLFGYKPIIYTGKMSASTTGHILNGKRLSLKPHCLNKLEFSHDSFESETVVKSTGLTHSGDEHKL
jgi:hypothetical protein